MEKPEMMKLMDIHEVADLVGLPVATLYQQRHHREGVGGLALRLGRHLRWRPEDINAWLDQQASDTKEGLI